MGNVKVGKPGQYPTKQSYCLAWILLGRKAPFDQLEIPIGPIRYLLEAMSVCRLCHVAQLVERDLLKLIEAVLSSLLDAKRGEGPQK
ncbi:hypothetical protein D3C86_1078530 [compost metagenome]